MKIQWEIIDDYTDRLKVLGGWIVRTGTIGVQGSTVHQVFVPDEKHEWKLEEETK